MRACTAAVLAALALTFVAAAPAKPSTPPPNVAGTTGEPPPAWFSLGGREGWLAYSSFCWTSACVDFLPPARRPDLPKIVARAGQVLRIHVGFTPSSVSVRSLALARSYALIASRDTSWRVRGSGVILVQARGAKGSASYVARIVR
jgi:hypothetical protein